MAPQLDNPGSAAYRNATLADVHSISLSLARPGLLRAGFFAPPFRALTNLTNRNPLWHNVRATAAHLDRMGPTDWARHQSRPAVDSQRGRVSTSGMTVRVGPTLRVLPASLLQQKSLRFLP
jgi:hypothetical protein